MLMSEFMAGPICEPLVSCDSSVGDREEQQHTCNTKIFPAFTENKKHTTKGISHPHGCRYPGKKSGHFGVDAGFLGHGAARSPAHNSEQTITTALWQTVLCHKRATAVSLECQLDQVRQYIKIQEWKANINKWEDTETLEFCTERERNGPDKRQCLLSHTRHRTWPWWSGYHSNREHYTQHHWWWAHAPPEECLQGDLRDGKKFKTVSL